MAKKRTPPRNKDGTFRKRKKRRGAKKRKAAGRRTARCMARNRRGRFTRWNSRRPGCRRRKARKARRGGITARRAAARRTARSMRRRADGTFIGKKRSAKKRPKRRGRAKKRARRYGPATPAWLRNRVRGLGSSSINAAREMIQEHLPGLSKTVAARMARAAVND